MPAESLRRQRRLLPIFSLAFLALFFFPLFFPKLRLMFFAPYIVIVCYHCSFGKALWNAFICGMVLDLFSSFPLFGLSALNYCLTTSILYFQTRHFFEDKPFTLSIMTWFFVIVSSILQTFLLIFLGFNSLFSWQWIMTDLMIMPLCDAAYAYLGFSLPFQLYSRLVKLWKYDSLRNPRR